MSGLTGMTRGAEVEPYLSLAAAVVIKAARDLHSIDNILAIDALLFWLGDCNYWLEALNLLIEPESVLIRVLRMGRRNAK